MIVFAQNLTKKIHTQQLEPDFTSATAPSSKTTREKKENTLPLILNCKLKATSTTGLTNLTS